MEAKPHYPGRPGRHAAACTGASESHLNEFWGMSEPCVAAGRTSPAADVRAAFTATLGDRGHGSRWPVSLTRPPARTHILEPIGPGVYVPPETSPSAIRSHPQRRCPEPGLRRHHPLPDGGSSSPGFGPPSRAANARQYRFPLFRRTWAAAGPPTAHLRPVLPHLARPQSLCLARSRQCRRPLFGAGGPHRSDYVGPEKSAFARPRAASNSSRVATASMRRASPQGRARSDDELWHSLPFNLSARYSYIAAQPNYGFDQDRLIQLGSPPRFPGGIRSGCRIIGGSFPASNRAATNIESRKGPPTSRSIGFTLLWERVLPLLFSKPLAYTERPISGRAAPQGKASGRSVGLTACRCGTLGDFGQAATEAVPDKPFPSSRPRGGQLLLPTPRER